MIRKPTPKLDDLKQSKRFIEIAREVEADGDAKLLKRAVRKIASAKRVTKPSR